MAGEATGRQLGTQRYTGTVGRVAYQSRLGTLGRVVGTVPVAVRAGSVEAIVGTVPYVRRMGTLAQAGTLDTLRYQGRLGSVGRSGSAPYLGTVNRLAGGRLGSLGSVGRVTYVARVGSVGRIVGTSPVSVKSGTLTSLMRLGSLAQGSITIARRNFAGTVIWDRRHAGVGSTYVGSWQYIGPYRVKTVVVRSSLAGSLFIVLGPTGTGIGNNTGTYNSTDLGAGTYHPVSFTEAFAYMRPIVRTGSVGSGKGTLTVSLMRQA